MFSTIASVDGEDIGVIYLDFVHDLISTRVHFFNGFYFLVKTSLLFFFLDYMFTCIDCILFSFSCIIITIFHFS